MGLDMYLEKFKRLGLEPSMIDYCNSYAEWIEGNKDCTFEDWCGYHGNIKNVEKAYEIIKPYIETKYYVWDSKHKYPHKSSIEEIGYWRKANHIHAYFVDMVQDGEDDCCYHNEVTKDILLDLKDRCEKIIESCPLVDGEINNGYEFKDGQKMPIIEQGKVMTNIEVAEDLLPTQSGFFFGSEDYDEDYMRDIEDTLEIINKALKETDFDNEMLYYVSSW